MDSLPIMWATRGWSSVDGEVWEVGGSDTCIADGESFDRQGDEEASAQVTDRVMHLVVGSFPVIRLSTIIDIVVGQQSRLLDVTRQI